jgi:hypothetical protein
MANATTKLFVAGLLVVLPASARAAGKVRVCVNSNTGAWASDGATACYGAPQKLTVVMFDYAGASAPVLATAAREAQTAFQAAGVETDWVVCQVSADPSRHCVLPPPDTFLRVMILPAPAKGAPLAHNCLGYATECRPTDGCIISYVFYRRVLAYAQNANRPVAITLAWVMAHEIGHLMGMEHGSSGIMKAHFDRRDLPDSEIGRLRFNGDDAKKLRTAIALWIGAVAGTAATEAR